MDFEKLQKQIDACDIHVEEILQEHLRTPYKHDVIPCEGVPVLERVYNNNTEDRVNSIMKKRFL